MSREGRVSEYISAAARLACHLELRDLELSWEEFEYLQDTLFELLERSNDVLRPVAEEAARARKA